MRYHWAFYFQAGGVSIPSQMCRQHVRMRTEERFGHLWTEAKSLGDMDHDERTHARGSSFDLRGSRLTRMGSVTILSLR